MYGFAAPLAAMGQGLLQSARDEEAAKRRDETARSLAQLKGEYAQTCADAATHPVEKFATCRCGQPTCEYRIKVPSNPIFSIINR